MINKNSTRYYSNKQEKKVAKLVKGKQTSNSGATNFIKGDVLNDKWLIECKTCMKPQDSFSIKKEWLQKNREEALAMRKYYHALAFNFGTPANYYVVDEYIFKELIELLDKIDN